MKTERVNELDILRFFAAMCVVIFHYAFRGHAAHGMSDFGYHWLAPIAKYGYLGAELFFMISGFVILGSASAGGVRKFVVSRASRLFPALWVCCTLTFIATLTIDDGRFAVSGRDFVLNMTLLAGFLRSPYVDGAYWSLTVELTFYAWIAILLLLRQVKRLEAALMCWLVLTFLLQAFPALGMRRVFAAEYSSYFIAGAMFYLWRAEGFTALRLLSIAGCLVLSVLTAYKAAIGLSVIYGATINPFVVSLCVVGFYAVFAAIATRQLGWLAVRDFSFFGSVTYPLYLIHQNIGYMIFNKLGSSVNPHALFWGVILVMVTSAWAVNEYIEEPLGRRLKTALSAAARKLPIPSWVSTAGG